MPTEASGWEKGIIEKNVQRSRRRIRMDAGKLRFGSFTELNAWQGNRCRALWSELRHPEHDQFSVAEMPEHEPLARSWRVARMFRARACTRPQRPPLAR